jgi:hypothetical protein
MQIAKELRGLLLFCWALGLPKLKQLSTSHPLCTRPIALSSSSGLLQPIKKHV